VYRKEGKRGKSAKMRQVAVSSCLINVTSVYNYEDMAEERLFDFVCMLKDWVTRLKTNVWTKITTLGPNKNLQNASLMRCRHCYFPRGSGDNIWEK
jgi:hypothetical protein